MRLFDVAQPVQGSQLYLPYPMRAALGWHKETKLYCWSRETEGEQQQKNQISISAIKPRQRELWLLSARFHDRPGLLAELSGLLTLQFVNIISCRASTHLQNTEFVIEMDIDTNEYISQFDRSRQARQHDPGWGLKELHSRIVCAFIRDIMFDLYGEPNLTITRHPVLSDDFSGHAEIFRYDVALRHGCLHLNRATIAQIAEYYAGRYGAEISEATPLALLVADVAASVVDATIFYLDTGHRHLRILSLDQIGTLELIASALKERKFNILQAYHRTYSIGGDSVTDLFVEREGTVGLDEASITAELESALRSEALKEIVKDHWFPPPAQKKRSTSTDGPP